VRGKVEKRERGREEQKQRERGRGREEWKQRGGK
jgi:hypothetical protein